MLISFLDKNNIIKWRHTNCCELVWRYRRHSGRCVLDRNLNRAEHKHRFVVCCPFGGALSLLHTTWNPSWNDDESTLIFLMERLKLFWLPILERVHHLSDWLNFQFKFRESIMGDNASIMLLIIRLFCCTDY